MAEITVHCDGGCGTTLTLAGPDGVVKLKPGIVATERVARALDWVFRGKKAFCPYCVNRARLILSRR